MSSIRVFCFSFNFLLLILFSFLISCSSQKVTSDKVSIPSSIVDIDSYIQERESLVKDVVPNTEKRIVWAGEKGVKTSYSLVYLPGYSSTRQEIAPIPEMVAKNLGINLFETRFKGNGIKGGRDSYKGLKIEDHLYDAKEALEVGKLIGDKVILMGTSTGAPFGIWLAEENAEDIEALVFISPNNYPANAFSSILLWPCGKQLFEIFMGSSYYGFPEPKNESSLLWEATQKGYWSAQQHVDATIAMMQIVDIAESINPEGLIPPYLMIYSEKDTIVSVKALKSFFEKYGKDSLSLKKSVSVIGSPSHSQHAMVGRWSGEITIEPTVEVITEFLEKVFLEDNIAPIEQEVIYEELIL